MQIDFEKDLESIELKGLLRSLRNVTCHQNSSIQINQKDLINFSSNDYLGLAYDDECIQSAVDAARDWGTGSGASRLLTGSLDVHRLLEEKIAEFKLEEAALIFSSGYQANLGIIQSLASKDDQVILDRNCHASLVDGARLSGARLKIFKHSDLSHLESVLKRDFSGKTWVISESYFSMDGDVAPLKELVEIVNKYGANLLIDEAHAMGVWGPEGRGLLVQEGLQGKVDFVTGTFSKSLASQGGFVCSSSAAIKFFINKTRSFIYSTAPSPINSAVAMNAIDSCIHRPRLRQKLWENVDYLRNAFVELGLDLLNSQGPIIPILIGNTKKALELSNILLDEGIAAPAIRPPTVSQGADRIRLSVSAKHTKDDLDHLITVLSKKL